MSIFSTSRLRLDFLGEGWRLSCPQNHTTSQSGSAIESTPDPGSLHTFGKNQGSSAPNDCPRWLVSSRKFLQVCGWDARTKVFWQGMFKPDMIDGKVKTSHPSRLQVNGLASCRAICLSGTVIRDDGRGILSVVIEYAMPESEVEASCAMAWRATVTNEGQAAEIDTITQLDGYTTTFTKVSRKKAHGTNEAQAPSK